MRGLNGRSAIVTGGGGGIGEATVRRLVEEGVRVTFADWDIEKGNALAAALKPEQATFVAGDMSVEGDCNSLVEAAVRQWGGLDIVVNNAGIRTYEGIADSSAASWQRMLGVNLMGYVFTTKAAVTHMRDRGGGAIVNVASIRSLQAGSKTVQYDTSKAAILGLTRSVARDHARDSIRVNAVGPGPIYTPFHRQRARELGQSSEAYQYNFGAGTMLKRPAQPGEVASAIAFLASDEASYVTGTCLYVDGGLTAGGD